MPEQHSMNQALPVVQVLTGHSGGSRNPVFSSKRNWFLASSRQCLDPGFRRGDEVGFAVDLTEPVKESLI
jgi:hypothetical protein